MPTPDRSLPTDALKDLEYSVLGGIILRNEILAELPTLEVDDFALFHSKTVFECIRGLEALARPIDVVTLELEIERRGKLEAIGGVAFLGELALRVPTVDNVIDYARQLQDRATVRRIALVASDLLDRARKWDDDVNELLGKAMADLTSLDRAKPTATSIGDLAERRRKELDAIVEAKRRGEMKLTGVPSGIAKLDERIGGYQFGIVNLLAARPAMGKTAMAIAAVDAATSAGYGAHVFPLEEGWRAYTDRALSRTSKIAAEKLRAGDIDRSQMSNLIAATGALRKRDNWQIDDRSGLSATEIVRAVRSMRRKLKTRLVIVDYVQLVRRMARLDENAAIYEIMTTFSHAAKADDIAYLVLSQLNREVEKRPDKRPTMPDLRGSGALEEQAKIIVSPYRGYYYANEPKRGVDYDCDCHDAQLKFCKHRPGAEEFRCSMQVLILKNSGGQEGRVFATWTPETMEMS